SLPNTAGRPVRGAAAAQHLLTDYFGYHPFVRFRDHGSGDPVLALTWGMLSTPDVSATVSLGTQLPVGKPADPDNPLAVPFSTGHGQLIGRLSLEDREGRPLIFSATLQFEQPF